MLSTLSQVLRGYKEVMCLCMDTKHLRLPTLASYRTWPLSFSRLKRYAGTQGAGAQDSHILGLVFKEGPEKKAPQAVVARVM